MIITKLKEAALKDTPHKVLVSKLYDKESANVVHIQLNPGEGLKPHITPVDVFFYILEGTTTVQIAEEMVEVEKDSLVESPKGIVHSLYNKSDSVTRILVVKAPRP